MWGLKVEECIIHLLWEPSPEDVFDRNEAFHVYQSNRAAFTVRVRIATLQYAKADAWHSLPLKRGTRALASTRCVLDNARCTQKQETFEFDWNKRFVKKVEA